MLKQLAITTCLLWAFCSQALGSQKLAKVRLGIAIDAPEAQTAAILAQVLPQTGAQIQLVGHKQYMATADRLGVLWPYSPLGARRIGRVLHLTHVAVFEAPAGGDSGNTAVLLRVRLVDVRTGRVPVHRRFALPDGQMSAAAAQSIMQALRYMLLGERPRAQSSDSPDKTALAPLDQSPAPLQKVAAAAAAIKTAAPADAGHTAEPNSLSAGVLRAQKRTQTRLGWALGLRRAQLSPQGAPCYCSEGHFAPPIFGLRAASELFFDPNITHFGVRMEAALQTASLPVDNSVMGDESQTWPWSMQADVAYRFFDAAPAALMAYGGVSYARFPINRGAFVGTGYTSLYTGTALQTQRLRGLWILEASGSFLLVVHSGLEAARLGVFKYGLGWQVQAGPSVQLGPFRIGANARFGVLTTQYAQTTALFSTNRYTNVRLDDATLDFQVHIGGALW